MGKDIISKKLRNEVREYLVEYSVLREIQDLFDLAEIKADLNLEGRTSSQRRTLIEQHFTPLDFSCRVDVKKFIVFLEAVFEHLDEELEGPHLLSGREALNKYREKFERYLNAEGFEILDGKIIATSVVYSATELREAAETIDAPGIAKQIELIEQCLHDNPALAIGTGKELVESVCKTILGDREVAIERKWELMDLVKKTLKELKLTPDDIPDSAKAAKSIKRLLNNLTSITQCIAEIRNAYGSGHGKDGRAKGLEPRHAQLAAGASTLLARFMFETHEERK